MILSAILTNQTKVFMTYLLLMQVSGRVASGDTVFALGNVPIGRISNIYPNSSKVVLFQ